MKPSKLTLAFYLMWVSFNLLLFVTGDDKFDSNDRFWPLEDAKWQYYYDWTELMFYCVVPVILWAVIKLLLSGLQEQEQEQKERKRRRDLGL